MRVAASGFLFCAAVFGQIPAKSPVSGQIVAQAARSAAPAALDKTLKQHGVSVKRQIPQLNALVLTVPSQAVEAAARGLARSGQFTFVETDGTATGAVLPNDPSFGSQWHLSKVSAPSAWDVSVGSSTVVIAMVDSGVDPTHPDLASRLKPGWNFLGGNTDTRDVLGHGTATAGTAAAASNNLTGVSGITWANPVMPLVVLNSSNYASYSDIANAIVYAADRGVRIINVSIGGTAPSSTLQSAINYAWGKGSVVFASAMNAATSAPYYPAACDLAIAVSATDSGDLLAGFSNYGFWVDFAAPGVSILTTSRGGGYGYWSGTSFSSPLTAGVAALTLSVNPSLSGSALVGILQRSAVDLGASGFDPTFGWGRIDARAAVTQAAATLQVDGVAPQVTILSPAANATVSGALQVAGSATDNVGVVRVEFSVDGQVSASSTSGSFAFPWNTAAAANGLHTLTVRAYDAVSNTSAASIVVNVNNPIVTDTQPPLVSIVSPLSGTVVGQKPVAVTASASDNRAVVQVSIYIDDVQVYTGSSAPYSYSWNARKAQRGTHTIRATAWDAAGNSATSATVSVIR